MSLSVELGRPLFPRRFNQSRTPQPNTLVGGSLQACRDRHVTSSGSLAEISLRDKLKALAAYEQVCGSPNIKMSFANKYHTEYGP
jgi:hypothetical protein